MRYPAGGEVPLPAIQPSRSSSIHGLAREITFRRGVDRPPPLSGVTPSPFPATARGGPGVTPRQRALPVRAKHSTVYRYTVDLGSVPADSLPLAGPPLRCRRGLPR